MRLLGWLATILGVVGVVVCLVVAVGVWVVRPAVTDKVHEVAAIASEGLADADELAVVAGEQLTKVSDQLVAIQGVLDAAATSPLVDTAVGSAIRDAVSGFAGGPFADMRKSFAGLRERVVGLSGVVEALDVAIPGIELPGVVTDTVNDIDTRLTQLDETVASAEAIAGNGVTTSQQLTQLSTQVSEINEVIGAVVPALGATRAQIADAEQRIDRVTDQADSAITLIAVGVTILFVYLALLNLLLYKQGRRWVAAARAEATQA